MKPYSDHSFAPVGGARRAIFLFLLFLLPGLCAAQQETFTTKYGLDFRPKGHDFTEWNTSSYIDGAGSWLNFFYDSDSSRLHILQSSDMIDNLRSRFILRMEPWQQLLLPDTKARWADISLAACGKNLSMCRLIVRGSDRHEKTLFTDTLSTLSNGRWQRFSTRVPLRKAVFLYLSIEADGEGGEYAGYPTGFAPADSTSEQGLSLGRIDIRLDGRPIDDFPVDGRMDITVPNPKAAVPLSFDDDELCGHIPPLRSKRVVALGETAHGSETMSRAAFQLIRHRIADRGCRLVLLEEHCEGMLSLNRFVQGEDGFVLDSLLAPFRYSINNSTAIREFCLWLRDYNRTSAEPVYLLGMDTDWTLGRPVARNNLLRYLLARSDRSRSAAVDSVCAMLLAPMKPPYRDADEIGRQLALWNRHEAELKTALGPADYAIIRLVLSNALRCAPDGNIKAARDRIMAENAKSLTDLLCPDDRKVTIYCHFAHANYLNQLVYSTPSTGFYLKKAWGDDYSCIGLHAGEGEYLVWDASMQMIDRPMSPPVLYSIESFLSKVPCDYFFMHSDKVPPVATTRYTGRYVFGSSFPGVFSPVGRMDGHIFLRRSAAMSIRPEDRGKEIILWPIWQDELRWLRSCYENRMGGRPDGHPAD